MLVLLSKNNTKFPIKPFILPYVLLLVPFSVVPSDFLSLLGISGSFSSDCALFLLCAVKHISHKARRCQACQ